MTKRCVNCGGEFARRRRDSDREWAARKVCSRSCRPSAADRLWAQVERRGADECWPWRGSVTSTGYGALRTRSRSSHPVHRLAYELLVGPIPDGWDIHHRCGTPICCNPAHMEPLTRGDHTRVTDGGAGLRARTHCKHGHEYTAENTRMRGNVRICRACGREANREQREKDRAAGVKHVPERRDRECLRCGEFKRADEFHAGNATYCGACKTEASREWRRKQKEARNGP